MGIDNRGVLRNKSVSYAGAVNDITLNFVDSGTDTETAIYFDLGYPARVFVIRPSANVLITEINNQTLDEPLSVSTNGFSWSRHLQWSSCKINISEASTVRYTTV